MSTYYVACELGIREGAVHLGELEGDRLRIQEVHRFPNRPLQDRTGLAWDIPMLFQHVVAGLQRTTQRDDFIHGVSCHSWGTDYLLFEEDGSVITPAFHHLDSRGTAGLERLLARLPRERVFSETGMAPDAQCAAAQLGAENPRRIRRAHRMLLVADAFNYLLSGVARAEICLAGTSLLCNPLTRSWSEPLVSASEIPPSVLPEVVPSGTALGPLKPELASHPCLDGTQVVASCSYEIAASFAAVPNPGGRHALLHLGAPCRLAMALPKPMPNASALEQGFNHQMGPGEAVHLVRDVPGPWLIEDCRRYWTERQQEMDYEVITHLAASSSPFECLINLEDPRFLTPGDIPEKVAAFCKETRQVVPRRPGQFVRCLLESLALHYRHTLFSMANLVGHTPEGLCLVGSERQNALLNHFIANALGIPVAVHPASAAAGANMAIQAVALGQLASHKEAFNLLDQSFPPQIIRPQPVTWEHAIQRFERLAAAAS